MVVRASCANPQILRWARVRAGLTIEAASKAIGREPDVLESWELGSSSPTYRQLADLAQRVYHRPLAVFFFPTPPDEKQISSEFRTLPDADREALEPDTLFALREARAWQLSAPDVLAGTDVNASRGTIADLRARSGESADELAARVHGLLDISASEQSRWRSPDEALKAWRAAIEEFGILVFKRPFKQTSVSGFCLDDPAYPIVVLNNSTSHTRQIFTLFHELGHLAFGVSGVTTRDEDLNSLGPSDRRVEIACNRFAASALLPPESIDLARIVRDGVEASISRISKAFQVGREVVLRRLRDSDLVSSSEYLAFVQAWRDDYLRKEEKSSGGTYYANVGTYLSERYARAVLFQYHSGRLGIGEAAEHLSMKAQNVDRFESFLLSRGVAE